MSNLRRLRPLVMPKTKIKVDPGPMPAPILLKTSQLRINDDYQRQLSRDSSRLAIKIACEFDWGLFHMPVVSPLDEVDDVTGLPLYEVLDGQHTSIGAISNGHVREIWCWPGRAGETLETRAESFSRLNTQRTAVTPVELFWAKVTAKDENALEVVEACHRTGASIIKRPKPYGNMRVGETVCVQQLTELANQGGRPYVERVLRICMSLRLSPISQIWIAAIAHLTLKKNSGNYLEGVPATIDLQIVNAVGRYGIKELELKAKMQHASEGIDSRQSLNWWLAFYIKKEVERHAAGQ